MKHVILVLSVFFFMRQTASSQSQIQFLFAVGRSYTPAIQYQRVTGNIDASTTGTIGFLYHPCPWLGIEAKLQGLSNPTSYLNSDSSGIVKAYTISHIVMQRILVGLHYYLPFKKIKPFLGILAGASYAETTQTAPQASSTKYTWGWQAGVTIPVYKFIALRLDASKIFIQHVDDNSAYFNTAADGSGFPSFAIGQPSRANIRQWNINLGLVLSVIRKKKQAL